MFSILVVLSFLLSSCSHLKYALIQAEYARIQNAEPGQVNLKHMLSHENFAVFGKTVDKSNNYTMYNLAISAYSSRFKKNELVDTMFYAGAGTHYGLYLPEGDYTLVVFADMNKDKILDKTEVVGQKSLHLNVSENPNKIFGHVDIVLTDRRQLPWVKKIFMPEVEEPTKSLFYPGGSIRNVNDPIFDEKIAKLGMYDPASFNEKVPTSFFTLEEDLGYKIPVVFVHGIGGSIRAFLPILERLDRKRFKPWFYYYASGADLKQLADLFYNIFLSGKLVTQETMPMIVVAHSMGGLVVREAFNNYGTNSKENRVELFISIATPFGGHPAAATGEKHGLIVLPAWRDVNPQSSFLQDLYRKPLPDYLHHHLIYAFDNPGVIKIHENSDGVVPLSSQLHPTAQRQSSKQFGFNSNHTAILENEQVVSYILDHMKGVKNIFPEDHLEYLFLGGYDVDLNDSYSPLEKYIIHNLGRYWMAVSDGTLQPFSEEQEYYFKEIQGEVPIKHDLINGWLRFMQEYPELGH